MSLDINVSLDGVRSPIARARVAEISQSVLRGEGIKSALVSITLVMPRAIAKLNAEHLKHSGPTDVISFGFSRATSADPVVGDIYICPDVARANARRLGASIREELARLVVHGTLHVLGYVHPDGDGREHSDMWRRQERLLKRLLAPRV
ncbi:MAG: rRNA maturation RNase YbeY [Gemmatimonadaceae bacterium]